MTTIYAWESHVQYIYIYIYITSVLTIKLKHILVQQYCFGKKIDLLDLRKIYI